MTDPQLILAGEPTGNLDAASAQEVLTLLSRLNQEHGKTVVMVTHDPHAARFASKIRYLDKGLLLPEGQAPEDWVPPASAATPVGPASRPVTSNLCILMNVLQV